MKRVRVLVVGILLGVMVGVGFVYAQQGSSSVLSSQDYDEIGQLYATINHGGDFRDADLWLSAFSDDAVFTIAIGPGQTFAGKEALSEWRHQSFRGQEGDAKVRHWDGPPRITYAHGQGNGQCAVLLPGLRRQREIPDDLVEWVS